MTGDILERYKETQTKRIDDHFQSNTPLLVDGEFGHDEDMAKIFSRYQKNTQLSIVENIQKNQTIDIYYIINAKHIVRDKQLMDQYLPFEKYLLKELAMIQAGLKKKAKIIITLPDAHFIPPHIIQFEELITEQGYESFRHSDEVVHILENKRSIFCSYETQNIPESLLVANNTTTQWTWLPFQNPDSCFVALAESSHYGSTLKNISVFENFVDFSHDYKKHITTIINKKLKIYKKHHLSGYIEEEQITLLEKILQELGENT